MECRFCGDEFDSKRGLHIHQAQVHDEADKAVREVLDHDTDKVKEAVDEKNIKPTKLLEAEERLADREDVEEFISSQINEDKLITAKEIDENIKAIENMESEIEESMSIKSRRNEVKKELSELEKKKEQIKDSLEDEKSIRKEEEHDVQSLLKEKKSLQKQVQELKNNINRKKKKRSQLKDKISKYRNKKQTLSQKVEELYEKIEGLNLEKI